LPSEAQFEYVAGGMQSTSWPWGSDAPQCDETLTGFYSARCPGYFIDTPAPIDWLPGARPRDRFDLPGRYGGTLLDLVGSLSEFVRDRYQHMTDVCWGER